MNGWTAQNQGDNTNTNDMIFDVEDYQHPSCFFGYNDEEEDNFYQVYNFVFSKVAEGEIYSNHDIPLGELEAMFPSNFGNSTSDYKTVVLPFYAAWDNFSTRLSFAWEDKYDTRDAEHRRIRKAMENENQKSRKTARKERNEEVLKLVTFVKKMDPRVQAFRDQVEREKKLKKEEEKREAEKRKEEMILAKEKWREERKREIEEHEREVMADSNNRNRFMFRLDDEEEDFGKKKKGKKGGKKKKKGKNRSKWDSSDDEMEREQKKSPEPDLDVEQVDDKSQSGDEKDAQNSPAVDNDNDSEEGQPTNEKLDEVMDDAQPVDNDVDVDIDISMDDFSSSEEESEDEPDVYKCDICRKEFKTKGSYENHLKSKKHKEAVKKHEKKMKGQGKKAPQAKKQSQAEILEQEAMEDLMNEFEDM